MERIYQNGVFYTMDAKNTMASAVAVKDGRFVSVGSLEQARAALPGAEETDLQGRAVLPGLADTHMHLFVYVQNKRYIPLRQAKSAEDVVALFQEGLRRNSVAGGWLVGEGWIQNTWENPRFPTKEDLDRVSQDVPVAAVRACLHISCVNSKALEIMGLNETSPGAGIMMDIGPDGKLNGILRESAAFLWEEHMQNLTAEQYLAELPGACRDLLSYGITTAHTEDFANLAPDCGESVMAVYRALDHAGKLPLHLVQHCIFWDCGDLRRFLSAGHVSGQTWGRYRIGPVKLLLDGSLGARTAWLRAPYADDSSTRGIPLFTPEELEPLVKLAHDNGMQIAAHAIGDATIEMLLNAYDRACRENPRPDPRHSIIHCQITDEPLLQRIHAGGYMAHIQPIFVKEDCYVTQSRVGDELASTSYAWRRMGEIGIPCSGGSDYPVESFNVMRNIACAVCHNDVDAPDSPAWYPENGLTVEQAVRLFTTGAAYASREEAERGSMEVGKIADLAVLDRDVFQVDPREIASIKVLQTVVEGETAYLR